MSKSSKSKYLTPIRLSFVAWLAMLITVSLFPLTLKYKIHTIGHYHDFAHYIAYSVTGIFLWLAFKRWPGRVLALLFGVFLSMGQEWAENVLYHAGFEYRDVASDVAGLVSGYALMLMISVLFTDPVADHPASDANLRQYRS